MFTLVDQWRSSGQKRDEFCRAHQIKVSTLSYWITRKNKADAPEVKPAGFVRVDPGRSYRSAEAIEIVYPNGVRLRVGAGNRSDIGALIRAW